MAQQQRGKKYLKTEQSLRELWENNKMLDILRHFEKECGTEKYLSSDLPHHKFSERCKHTDSKNLKQL